MDAVHFPERLSNTRRNMIDKKEIIETLGMIVQDQVNDAKNFEGAPFTGRTVAEYFGNQGAAIAALATIIKSLVESLDTPPSQ